MVRNGHLAPMTPGGIPYGTIEDGLVAVSDGRIRWIGAATEAPRSMISAPVRTLDAGGGWITPGLIDCHTHLVFGGNRAREFEMRLGGATYAEIAAAGGGILSTVRATRSASDAQLLAGARERLRSLMAQGVTSVEIKSGYGLDVEQELRLLRLARSLGVTEEISVTTTLLGAHALPPEWLDDRSGYLDRVCEEMIPTAVQEGLADAVDAFCEGIAFSPAECRRVLEAGATAGLEVRLHADQLSDLGGAALAASLGARSADHLEYTSEEGAASMGRAGTVAVLLPGAFYMLGETRRPPVAAFRRHGVAMAVATDLNPGSSPLSSPLLAMNMACTLFGLTPEEALAGMTRTAASVLGADEDRGTLTAGLRADMAIWDVEHPSELSYWLGRNPCRVVVSSGRVRSEPRI